MSNSLPQPPKWINALLRRMCKPELLEEIEGDLLEYYRLWVIEYGRAKANRMYCWHAIKFLRLYALKSMLPSPILNPIAMFKHTLLLAFRNFKRYKSSFFINLIGLSSGLACTLLIYLWVNDELSMDDFHEKGSRLFQVMERQELANGIAVESMTPSPLAKALKEEIPEIEFASASAFALNGKQVLSVDENEVRAVALYANEDYFNIFSYELIHGYSDELLKTKNNIVLSESMAMGLFKSIDNVIGRMVKYQNQRTLSVSGVFKDIPSNSSIQFDFVLPFEILEEEVGWLNDWRNNYPETYVVLQEGVDAEFVNSKVSGILHNKAEGAENRTVFIKSYAENYLYGNYENGIQAGGRIEYVHLFSLIALFILFMACVNFMNLTTAQASRRLKEIGVKKVIGANRMTLMIQYLGESILMAMLSLVIALVIVVFFLPQFNAITGKQLVLHFEPSLLISLIGISLLTGLISGSYPAIYLSGFRPIVVLKGKLNRAVGELWIRRGLVVFQFVISIVIIVFVSVIYNQIDYLQNKELGYDRDNILYFEAEGEVKSNFNTFIDETRKIPVITDVSSAYWGFMGEGTGTHFLSWEGKNPDDVIHFEYRLVNYDLVEMLGIEMTKGRGFSTDFNTENEKIIINEAAAKVMGFDDPVGETMKVWNNERQIIGVTKNFHFASLHDQVKPMMFLLAPETTSTIFAKIQSGREREAIASLEEFNSTFNPGFPFAYQFLDTDYQAFYESEEKVATLSKYFAILAILISCLGLFGLAAFTAERRTKEIGIRIILGSSTLSIVRLLTNDFAKMVMVAITIALPIGYFITREWLDNYAYSIELTAWFFAGAAMLTLFLAMLTVGFQTLKAAYVNPSECLKDE